MTKPLVNFAKRLKSLKNRTTKDPLSWWRPTIPQSRFINDKSPIKLLLGGNQVGKTSAACALLIYHCLGIHPDYAVDPPPIEAWIITHSIEQSRTIQAKLWDMLPKQELCTSVEFVRGRGFRGVTPLVTFANGSIIRIKTANQGLGLASASCNLVVIDEPVPAEVFNECLARTLRGGAGGKAGTLAISMTPVGNVDVHYIKDMVHNKQISCTNAPLTVEMTQPIGLKPLLTQAQIDNITAGYLPIDREARIYGSFDVTPQGVIFDKFDPATMIINRPCPPAKMYKYSVGIDHGTAPGSQCAILSAINMEDPQNPEVYILAEYISGGSATPEDHARGILDMLKRHHVRPELCKWTGDGDHYGGRGKTGMHMSNLVLMRAFERILGLHHRCLPWTIRKAIKKRHSVYFSASMIYALQSRKQFFVRAECQKLIQSMQNWTMKRNSSDRSRDPHGHAIDAMRYCIMPIIDYKYITPHNIRIA
tara:strand:+ start:910 stop:2343 length:1434 start_codon:yes stop_codon:yes gene_type:complete